MTTDPTVSFREDMIDLTLSGKKTLTIRPMKPQPKLINDYGEDDLFSRYFWLWKKEDLSDKGRAWTITQYPHGQIGDVMTIRERPETKLKITSIDAKRFEDVSHETWKKDGVPYEPCGLPDQVKHWESFYTDSPYHWIDNPWCWIIEFEQVK